MTVFPTGYSEKITPHVNDMILLADSEDANKIKEGKYSAFKWADSTVPWPEWNGIESIVLQWTVWKVKTYRITYTDLTTYDFDVTDGADWAGTWDMEASTYDPTNKAQDVFAYADLKKTYDAVVAWTGWDYTTVWGAITAGKTNIFVRDGSYAETFWDCSTKNINIVAQSHWVVFTFNNTDAHSGVYILSDGSTNLWINWGKFLFTLNSTNTKGIGWSSGIAIQFKRENSYITVASDDALRYLSYLYTEAQNGFYNCNIEFTNGANGNSCRLAQSTMSFNDCYILNGNIYLNTSTFRDCHFHWLTNCQMVDSVFINTTLATWTISWNTRRLDNSFIDASSTWAFEVKWANGSKVYIVWAITLSWDNTNAIGAGITNCMFYSSGDITLNTYMSNCYIGQCANINLDSADSYMVNCRALVVTSIYLTTNADYAQIIGCKIVNGNKIVIQAGCTWARIIWNYCWAITDGGTTSVIANNN